MDYCTHRKLSILDWVPGLLRGEGGGGEGVEGGGNTENCPEQLLQVWLTGWHLVKSIRGDLACGS